MATKMLTPEQWAAVVPPFCGLRIKNEAWGAVQRDIVVKWIEAHIGGWFYFDGIDTYVFERPGDKLLFRMWVVDDPFEDGFDIEIPS